MMVVQVSSVKSNLKFFFFFFYFEIVSTFIYIVCEEGDVCQFISVLQGCLSTSLIKVYVLDLLCWWFWLQISHV